MTKVVHVAVGILQKPSGEILLASRPQGKGWAGWWEFPGGKIEANESPEVALARELKEELGVTPTAVQAWLIKRFDYPATHDAEAKTVLLHFYFVTQWAGDLTPLEGQKISWNRPSDVQVNPILPANAPIMQALALPEIYAISNVAKMGESTFLKQLRVQLDKGLRLIQVDERHLSTQDLTALTGQILRLCEPYDAKLLVNHTDAEFVKTLGVAGIHYPSNALMQLTEKTSNLLVAASCHNAIEIAHAEALSLDMIVVSPVLASSSHPDIKPMGWPAFNALIQNSNIPVYAMGGIQNQHLNVALENSARGIAMQHAIWN